MLTQAELQHFEAPLIALANLSSGDLRKLFHAFFSFLHRRTDFYCIGGNSAMGFQEGQAEKILLASFRQFPLKKMGPKPSSGSAAAKSTSAPIQAEKTAPNKTEAPKSKEPSGKQSAVTSIEGKLSTAKVGSSVSIDATKEGPVVDKSAKSTATNDKPAKMGKNDTIRYTDEGKQIPIGNGGSTCRYVWTQTLEEVTVHLPLPEGLRAKDLDVKIGANKLSILQKDGNASQSAFASFEGTLFAKIRPSESTWTLETTTHSSQKMTTLQLILDKIQKTWWATVVSGDTPLIDTTMVDSTRHIGTYDEQTQAQIRRILFDQRQERLGLPTSQQTTPEGLPPLPKGREVKVGGKISRLPPGVEFIDGETLDKASISNQK